MLVVVCFVGGLLIIIYLWLTKNNDYWQKKGVKYVEPHLFVGNMVGVLTKKTTTGDILVDTYRQYKNEPYVGMFNMRKPILLLRNLDVIRDVLVTQFSKFHDNLIPINEDTDSVLAKNLFFLKGERWKIIRAQLTPLLTLAKVKAMYPLVEENCGYLVKYIKEHLKSSDGLEAKDICLKFTTDNVASCAFGLVGNSFDDSKAEFKKLVQRFFYSTFSANLKVLITQIFPELITIFKVSISVKEVSDQLKDMIVETINYRKENNISRNDYLDSIMELKSKPTPFEYSDDYMVGHALTFLLDGAETSSIAFTFALYELAVNPDVQNKLRKEIDLTLAKHNGKMTFDSIPEMSYLDAVFLESLRKYPPLIYMGRECNENFLLPRDSQEPLLIEKGAHVYVPVMALHRDPQYYPDPDRFDPDRFTENAKHPLPKNCFFGFGDGPRTCIGKRFANMQIKAGIITIFKDFEVRLNEKTKLPLDLDFMFLTQFKTEILLDFYRRTDSRS